MIAFRKLCLGVAALALLALVAGLFTGNSALWQPAAMATLVGLAIGLGGVPALKSYQFTAWILVAVAAGMIFPKETLKINLTNKLIIVQAVMFGMGTQMKLADFKGVLKMPWAVAIGVFGQFTIMPLVGFALTKIFHFEPEIGAGIILIGSCSAGLASNVMAYIAKANLALSITMTSVTTAMAPILTPMWMKLLVDASVKVEAFDMMMEIIKMVIVPIGGALLHDYLTFASPRGRKVVHGIGAVSALWLAVLAIIGWASVKGAVPAGALPWIGVIGYICAAILVGLAYHHATRLLPRLEKWMPLISMAGIVYFTSITTAAGRDNLMHVGGLLFVAAALHNTFGYVFAYWLARLCKLDIASCRTVAFEVGLQNGAMASGLASSLGKLGTMGLAAAIFSPWMNISGSILANYWRRRPAADNHD
jgi:bile acid:Na+ symporter, BASS family